MVKEIVTECKLKDYFLGAAIYNVYRNPFLFIFTLLIIMLNMLKDLNPGLSILKYVLFVYRSCEELSN